MAAKTPNTMPAMAPTTVSISAEVVHATMMMAQQPAPISNEVTKLYAVTQSTRKTIAPSIAETAMHRPSVFIELERVVGSAGAFMTGSPTDTPQRVSTMKSVPLPVSRPRPSSEMISEAPVDISSEI